MAGSMQDHWYATLSDEQLAAVSAPLDVPLLVVAGPGSGKTHFLVNRMIRDLREGSAVLALTFTRKAAEEMEKRIVRDPLTPKDRKLWIGTFHRLAITQIRAFPSKAGFPPKAQVSIAAKEHRKNAAAAILAKYPNLIGDLKLNRESHTVSDDTLPSDSEDEDCAKDPASLLARMLKNNTGEVAVNPLLSGLRKQFVAILRVRSMLLLADVILIATQMLNEYPGVKACVAKMAHSLYIDELQDTSDDQLAFLHTFCSKRVTAVGDDDQSIYEWRGGCSGGQVAKFGDRVGATYMKLNQNFRSTKPIVSVAISIIQHNRDRVDKSLFSCIEDASKPILAVKKDVASEAQWIAERIVSTTGNGSTFRDWAVLARLQYSLQYLATALGKFGIPVVNICEAQSVWTKKELDVLAYARMLVDPGNDPSFMRVYNTPRRGLTKNATLYMLKDLCGALASCLNSKETIFDRMMDIFESWDGDPMSPACAHDRSFWSATQRLFQKEIPKGPSRGLRAFSTLLEDMRNELRKPCSARDAITTILKATELEGGRVIVAASSVVKPSGLDAIRDFLRCLPHTSPDLTGDFVTLSTVHRAKGLEWDNVVLACCNEGTFPLANGDIPEERRLFYVGLTRARRNLCCTAHLDGSYPSSFFGEAGDGFESLKKQNTDKTDDIQSKQPVLDARAVNPMPEPAREMHIAADQELMACVPDRTNDLPPRPIDLSPRNDLPPRSDDLSGRRCELEHSRAKRARENIPDRGGENTPLLSNVQPRDVIDLDSQPTECECG